ncbi:MAG TPA: ribonuclease P protein component [Cytophagales bacterium]|nr:ribonuclease P protein component [Cytophagales bacterium]
MSSSLTFQKQERLKSEKVIKDLFEKGSSFYLYPFKIFYIKSQEVTPAFPQILFSVSKRNFKRAVDRNRLKRQIREGYRINKPELLKKIPPGIFPAVIGIMYVSKEKLPFSIIQNKLNLAFDCFESKSV